MEIDADAAPWTKRLESGSGPKRQAVGRALHFVGRELNLGTLRQDQVGNDGPAPDLRALGIQAEGRLRVSPEELDRRGKLLQPGVGQVEPEQVDPSGVQLPDHVRIE